MTPISFDTAFQLTRQRQQELERSAALARSARQARNPRRWSVVAGLRRRFTAAGVPPRPATTQPTVPPVVPPQPAVPTPAPAAVSRHTNQDAA